MKVLRHAATGAPEGWVVADSDLDDAAVLRLDPSASDGPLLVQTVDFITPVVDDPFVWGQVAAANALSDVYAMGGEPRFALNVAGFPGDLPLDIIGRVFEGGADKVKEAGAAIVGGHTVKDKEPKYGLSVTGVVHEEHLTSQGGAKAGDALVLSKALGTGLLVGAARQDALGDDEARALHASMTQLNRAAAKCMREVGAKAATDVTGFGLLGHAWHIAKASGLVLELDGAALPALPGARERAADASLGGAAGRNLRYVEHVLSGEASHADLRLAIDPQTSGGLLIAIAAAEADALCEALQAAGALGVIVGRALEGEPGLRWA